jgi:hypothetical protein
MNTIAFRVSRRGCRGRHTVVDVEIDGTPLARLAERVEREQARSEGLPGMAGSYAGLHADDVLPPSRHFLGEPASGHVFDDAAFVLGCDCGECACWPLACRIRVDRDRVTWSDFVQPFRSTVSGPSVWRYDALGPFVFDRSAYEAALASAARRAAHERGASPPQSGP